METLKGLEYEKRINMKTFTADWQQPRENVITEIGKNHFKFSSLNISTKDGSNYEMDARIIMEIDNDSIIFKNFGTFPVFVDKTLSVLVRNFFTYKEKEDIVKNRLKIQDQLIKLLQEKLTQYGAKIVTFVIIYTTMLSPFINIEDPKIMIRETRVRKNISLIQYYVIMCGFLGGFLLVLLSAAILLSISPVNIDIRILIGPCIIASIGIIVASICQYLEIEKVIKEE